MSKTSEALIALRDTVGGFLGHALTGMFIWTVWISAFAAGVVGLLAAILIFSVISLPVVGFFLLSLTVGVFLTSLIMLARGRV